MEKFSNEEINLMNSLSAPIKDIDMKIVNSIIDKMLMNKEYANLIDFLNQLNDFAKVPKDLIGRLINHKECIAIFLNNEKNLYFFTDLEKNRLQEILNVKEVFIRLPEIYNYYYNLLFKQGIRELESKINNSVIEHYFTKYNNLLSGFKIIEDNKLGVIVAYVNYLNYNLNREEQILKEIDYLNTLGFNIERDINNKNIIDKLNI